MNLDVGLLIVRLSAALMLFGHGWGKLVRLLQGETGFADPLGIGPLPSFLLIIFAEFVCALLVLVGFKTRLAAIPLVIAMLVAAFIHHWNDPWGNKEMAVLYVVVFLALVFTGAGKHSVDGWLARRRRSS